MLGNISLMSDRCWRLQKGHKTMFALGWLPRVIAIDSGLINFTQGPTNCTALGISQQLQAGDFTHRSCLRSPGLGQLEGKQSFSLPLEKSLQLRWTQIKPSRLKQQTWIFFFPPCSEITHLLLSSVPASLSIKISPAFIKAVLYLTTLYTVVVCS